MPFYDSSLDVLCPVCGQHFKTSQGMHHHLTSARSCNWWKKGKMRELTLDDQPDVEWTQPQESVGSDDDAGLEGPYSQPEPMDDSFPSPNSTPPPPSISSLPNPDNFIPDWYDKPWLEDEDEDFDIVDVLNSNNSRLLPPEDPPVLSVPEIGKQGPGPQTQAANREHTDIYRLLNDDEDIRLMIEHATAGAVLRQEGPATKLDSNGDVIMEDPENIYFSFSSELDWKIARWAVKDGPGHKVFDRLLSIPGVSFFFLGVSSILT